MDQDLQLGPRGDGSLSYRTKRDAGYGEATGYGYGTGTGYGQ